MVAAYFKCSSYYNVISELQFIAICVLPIITVLAQAFGKNLLGSMLVHRRYSTQAPMFAFRYVKSKRMHNRGSVHPSRASRSTKASSKQVSAALAFLIDIYIYVENAHLYNTYIWIFFSVIYLF